MPEDQFTKDSIELKNLLLIEAGKLSDKIDSMERNTESQVAYYGYLKDFLINSGTLCDDILQGVNNDVTLLAMIGTRTLLEDAINAHYLESKSDEASRMAVAADWFKISNDPEAYKNKVDGKTVVQRAELADSDTKDLHDGEYADFCNYTHSTAQRSILNLPDHRILAGKKATMVSLKAYANIVTCIARIIGEQTTEEVLNAARGYLDKYKQAVAEASLDVAQKS